MKVWFNLSVSQDRILAQSKENKKALAAAAGVELPMDSPVIEKSQPALSSSPLKESSSKSSRRYTAVLQENPLGYALHHLN